MLGKPAGLADERQCLLSWAGFPAVHVVCVTQCILCPWPNSVYFKPIFFSVPGIMALASWSWHRYPARGILTLVKAAWHSCSIQEWFASRESVLHIKTSQGSQQERQCRCPGKAQSALIAISTPCCPVDLKRIVLHYILHGTQNTPMPFAVPSEPLKNRVQRKFEPVAASHSQAGISLNQPRHSRQYRIQSICSWTAEAPPLQHLQDSYGMRLHSTTRAPILQRSCILPSSLSAHALYLAACLASSPNPLVPKEALSRALCSAQQPSNVLGYGALARAAHCCAPAQGTPPLQLALNLRRGWQWVCHGGEELVRAVRGAVIGPRARVGDRAAKCVAGARGHLSHTCSRVSAQPCIRLRKLVEARQRIRQLQNTQQQYKTNLQCHMTQLASGAGLHEPVSEYGPAQVRRGTRLNSGNGHATQRILACAL